MSTMPRQYRPVRTRLGWQASPPDIDHDLEREPKENNGSEPARNGPARGLALRPAVALRVDTGAVKPDHEHDYHHGEPEIGQAAERWQGDRAKPGRRVHHQNDRQRRRQPSEWTTPSARRSSPWSGQLACWRFTAQKRGAGSRECLPDFGQIVMRDRKPDLAAACPVMTIQSRTCRRDDA